MKGRPIMGKEKRVRLDTTISARSMMVIKRLQMTNESRGQVIDRALFLLNSEDDKQCEIDVFTLS